MTDSFRSNMGALAAKQKRLMIDPKYRLNEVIVAYQEARTVLKEEGFRPSAAFRQLCLWYALKEQEEGIRSEVRSTLDNMALISALELTISLPMYLNPPNFYELSANKSDNADLDNVDDMVRIWMCIAALVVIMQGACIFQTMNFRTFAVDQCISDIHFLPVYAKCWALSGSVGMLSITLFLGGLFGIIIQFCFSGFLLYAPGDCWAFVGVSVVLSLWILSNHVRYLQHTYSLAAGCTASFAERYCDEEGEVKADVINPLLKVQAGADTGAGAGGATSIVQSAARTEASATT